jgi:predicted adenylyl cyclase CyaB
MPVNVEIKARAAAWPAQLKAGLALADRVERLTQSDTFFNCSNGRLKLREQGRAGAYLVFYSRAGLKGPKASSYTLVPVKSAGKTKRSLSRILGVKALVKKKRVVCFAGRTRIHFDEVKGLGRYIELEVVMKPGEALAAGRREAKTLMRALGIRPGDLVPGAYADLLEQKL